MGAGRAGVTFVLMVALAGGCSAAARPKAAATTSTTEAPLTVTADLSWRFTPDDQSGVVRQDDSPNSACGVTNLGTRLAGWAAGNPVTVYDQNGHIVGTTTVPAGQVTQTPTPDASGVGVDFTCSWYVGISDIPPTTTFLRFVAGGATMATIDMSQVAKPSGTVEAQLSPTG
jgi:hypothetical protein